MFRFTSCHDLLLSRFCAAEYKDYGVIGIKIHRITRIHNRILRTQFDEYLASMVEEDEKEPYSSVMGNAGTNPANMAGVVTSTTAASTKWV